MPAGSSFVPRLEALPSAQRAIWPQLASATTSGFVLYGGTAIALRLGHRTSVDFDFFTDLPLDKAALRTSIAFLGNSTVLQDTPDTLTVLAQVQGEATIKVSFFGGIGFGRVGQPEMTADAVAEVASLDDLMATKLKVLLQRVEAKDYVDVAALLAAGVQLDRGLASARAIFGPTFQPSECLKALVYFEGGDLDTLRDETKAQLIAAASAVGALPEVQIVSRSLARHAGASGSSS